jgi:hypothetical protein
MTPLVAETVEQSFLRPFTTVRPEGHSFLYFQALRGAKVRLNLTFTGLRNGHMEWRVTDVD